jgi:hemerythrin superfamily protein
MKGAVLMELKVPQSIQTEHEELHESLAGALKAGGKTAEAARAVMKVVQPHMAREEEYVAPALALLGPAASGNLTDEMATFLPRIALLRGELPRMLREHSLMVEELRRLMQAAVEEKQPSLAKVAQRLIAHAQQEEELLYPAALLVGEALKTRFQKG